MHSDIYIGNLPPSYLVGPLSGHELGNLFMFGGIVHFYLENEGDTVLTCMM